MSTWRKERTGWRDAALSERHGHWGFNCPAVDLDFVMLEYNHGKPSAIVEFKHKNAKAPDASHATYRALVDLANEYRPGALPCFIAFYDPEVWMFNVIPLNSRARDHFAHCKDEWISEQRFVTGLHLLRKAVLSAEDKKTIAQLNSGVTQEVA